MSQAAREQLLDLAAQGAQIYVSHSGGKDSQALYAWVAQNVDHDQITVVHADLGEVEWEGVQTHIHENTDHEVNVVRAIDREGNVKGLLDMVRHRARTRPDVPAWPSSATRQCTSDLKRGPIHKFIRADLKARGKTLAVNATGLRAAESSARAKRTPATVNKELSKAGREVWDISPIHDWSVQQVVETIWAAGQELFWAYGAERADDGVAFNGNERLSCVFCIMGCDSDLAHGARQRPELARKYLQIERETGWTMFNGKSLADRLPADLIPAIEVQ